MRLRTRAREAALKYLYEYDIHEGDGCSPAEAYMTLHKVSGPVSEYALHLVRGVLKEWNGLNRIIEDAARNWRLTRMATIDRNLIRIGAFEILYADDVPGQVAINEALELAKMYGSAQSGSFVNGILDRILADRGGEGSPDPETALET